MAGLAAGAAETARSRRASPRENGRGASLSIGLSAVIVAATPDEPRVLALRNGADGAEALPSGPLESEHRTLEIGLRSWVERQTRQRLGYVEQLYTFGDRDRIETDRGAPVRALTVAYLALVRPAPREHGSPLEARPGGSAEAAWQNWYRYFPWEDWRAGRPAAIPALEDRLASWVRAASGPERRLREERVGLAFARPWNDELVLERYELLYEAGLIGERWRDLGRPSSEAEMPASGTAMAADHRRILATAIGRLRGKIKYRPVVFELMPPAFTLLQLQRTVEALSGVRLHKQNFRRLVEQQGLVEETGEISGETGGRPARLVRFRRAVVLERPAPGLRLRTGHRVPA
ncbi:MAG TPA: hypothetical protein VJ770_30135 [Stellaceae bacterium]|nr:hypothetical protein [Stellaceae bacterium]